MSSRDGEGEFGVFRIFLKKYYEYFWLYRVVRNAAFVWPPSVKHD